MLGLSHLFYARRLRLAVIPVLAVLAFAATPTLAARASTRSADLVTKIHVSNPKPGFDQMERLTAKLTNKGPDVAHNVVFRNSWGGPAFRQDDGIVVPGGCGPGSITTCVPCPPGSGIAVCVSRLAPGNSITIWVSVLVEGPGTNFLQPLQLSDAATATSTTFDPDTANNDATVLLPIYQPLAGETLAGTGTATSSGGCTSPVNGSGSFSIPSGTATGRFPGTFSESGTFTYTQKTIIIFKHPVVIFVGSIHANFTIKSGSKTITGEFQNADDTARVGTPCGSPTFSFSDPCSAGPFSDRTYQGYVQGNLAVSPTASITETFLTTTSYL